MELFIVKRPFRTNGEMYLVGSVIEDPTKIRLFKSKVNEGKIIKVNEVNLDRVAEYIESRTGVDIKEAFKKRKEEDSRKLAEEARKLAEEEAKKKTDEAKKTATVKTNATKVATVTVK